MPIGFAWVLAVVGASALIFGVQRKGENKRRIIVGIAGMFILLAALGYILLAYILINAV